MKLFLALFVSVGLSVTGGLYFLQPNFVDQISNAELSRFGQPSRKSDELLPAVIVGIGSGKNQVNDIDFLIDEIVEDRFRAGMIKGLFHGFLRKLAPLKRAGAVAFLDEQAPAPQVLVFVPVNNTDEFHELLFKSGEIEVDTTDEISTLDVANQQFHFVIRDQCFYFSNCKERLNSLPEDPESWLRSIPAQYNFGVVYDSTQVPDSFKHSFKQKLKGAIAKSAMPTNALVGAINTSSQRQLEDEIIRTLEETERLRFGINVDSDRRDIEIFVENLGHKSSRLALQGSSGEKLARTRYARFRSDSALMNLNLRVPVVKQDVAAITKMLNENESSENISDARLRAISKEVLNALQQTIESENAFDGAAVITSSSGAPEMALVFHVQDRKTLARLREELSKQKVPRIDSAFGAVVQQSKPNHRTIRLNGIRFYQQRVSTPTMPGSLVFGVSENDDVYIGFGAKPLGLLKACMEGVDVSEWDKHADVLFNVDLENFPPNPDLKVFGRSRTRGELVFVNSGYAGRIMIDVDTITTCFRSFMQLQ